jgi:hypothetical protein
MSAVRRDWDQSVTDPSITVIRKRYDLGKRLACPFLQLIVGHCVAPLSHGIERWEDLGCGAATGLVKLGGCRTYSLRARVG